MNKLIKKNMIKLNKYVNKEKHDKTKWTFKHHHVFMGWTVVWMKVPNAKIILINRQIKQFSQQFCCINENGRCAFVNQLYRHIYNTHDTILILSQRTNVSGAENLSKNTSYLRTSFFIQMSVGSWKLIPVLITACGKQAAVIHLRMGGGGVLRFGLDRGCALKLSTPTQFQGSFWQKKIPIVRNFSWNMGPFFRCSQGYFYRNCDPYWGISCEKVTH